jgi:hypothetical protein
MFSATGRRFSLLVETVFMQFVALLILATGAH